MDTFSAFIGSVIVAVITLIGNFYIQTKVEKRKYCNEYQKLLMNRKIVACERGIVFLQNFVKYDTNEKCFTWMLQRTSLNKVMQAVENLNFDLAWFTPNTRNKFIDLFNIIEVSNNYYKLREKGILTESEYADERNTLAIKIRELSVSLEPDLYEYLCNSNGVNFMINKSN